MAAKLPTFTIHDQKDSFMLRKIALAAAVAVGITALAPAPANAALTGTLVNNAANSNSSLVVQNYNSQNGLLKPGQSSGTFYPKYYYTDAGMCTDLFDHSNGYRVTVRGSTPGANGYWAGLPWAGHEYTIVKYYCW